MRRETFEDKTLNCKDCNQEFLFSASEQEIFSKRGFQDPVRCYDCRKKKKEKYDK
jgi:hypothetical protein